jgi:multiple sugar transport system permease protein
MMVPFTVVIIPLFITMKDLGLVNKIMGIILTSLCSTFGIFLMRQAIESIPNDYIEAARVDGASELWILIRVIMPLARPAMATLAVFTFLGNWDSYMWPSILLRSPDTKTLPVVVAGMQSLLGVRYNYWAAGSMLTVVPVMALFVLMRKQFIKGLAMTGLKG